MALYLKKGAYIAIALFVIPIGVIILMNLLLAVSSVLFPNDLPPSISGLLAVMWYGQFLVIFLIPLPFLVFVGSLWLEILTSKNELMWKFIWILAVTLLGIVGWVAYYYVGRKSRIE